MSQGFLHMGKNSKSCMLIGSLKREPIRTHFIRPRNQFRIATVRSL